MSKGTKAANLGSVVLVAFYVVVSAALWVIAYNTNDDKSRAALIGVAGAVSTGGAAVLGGLFTGWRSSSLQQRREDRQQRQQIYAQLLSALAEYGGVCRDLTFYQEAESTGISEKARTEAREQAVLSERRARELLAKLAQVTAAVEIVAPAAVAATALSMKEEAKKWVGRSAEINERISVEFIQQARTELAEDAGPRK